MKKLFIIPVLALFTMNAQARYYTNKEYTAPMIGGLKSQYKHTPTYHAGSFYAIVKSIKPYNYPEEELAKMKAEDIAKLPILQTLTLEGTRGSIVEINTNKQIKLGEEVLYYYNNETKASDVYTKKDQEYQYHINLNHLFNQK